MKVSFNEEQMEELKDYIRECIDNLKEELEEKEDVTISKS